MPIVTLQNPKGGAGKSSAARIIARGLQLAGQDVRLVDADPQGTIRDWHATREDHPTPVLALDTPELMRNLKQHLPDPATTWAVVDTAGRLEGMQAAAIRQADLVVLPVQPSPDDVWAVQDLVETIQQRQEITEGLPQAAVLITRATKGTRLGREIDQAIEDLGLNRLDAILYQRQAIPRAFNEGKVPQETEPEDSDAAAESRRLVRELLEWGGFAEPA
jgi:chromosome partitioning protein